MPRSESPRNTLIDHFYHDEAESGFTRPPPANIFHNVDFTFQIESAQRENPIEAAEQAKLKLPHERVLNEDYFIFVPAGTRAAVRTKMEAGEKLTVRVSLLFAVRDQFNRAGLRSFFAQRDDAVLITVPGRETRIIKTKQGKKTVLAWGIGISDAQIESLFKTAFRTSEMPVNYQIEVIAAYSTGYRGMQGTILENAKKKFITLTHVRKMIYYDCLVKGDGNPPSGYPVGERTEDAVSTLLKANPGMQLGIYEVTDGTKRYGGSLAVNVKGQILINLKPFARELTTLQYARLLDEAQRDGFISDKEVPASIKALLPLPDRGSVTSDKRFVGVGTNVLLQDWASRKAMAVSRVQADLGLIDRIIYDNFLMGWRPPRIADLRGEVRHDQFMPEFAWELLPPG
jgi:hypothetical protein